MPPDEIHRPLRVCYVQAYRAPQYIRGRSLCEALERTDSITLSRAVNSSVGWRRYWEAISALLRIRSQARPDIYVLGFRGHEIAWLVRWLTRGQPLVLDAMMSPYAALHEESKHGVSGRVAGPLVRLLERAVLAAADLVLTDTQAHVDYYARTFGVPRSKLLAIPVGAEEAAVGPPPAPSDPSAPLRVLFYGSLLPLHGIDTVLEAAAMLVDSPVAFEFVGGTPSQGRLLVRQCTAAGIAHRWRAWVPFQQLIACEIPCADVCLGGPFGGTPQARRVVTGKTSQCLALKKATVIGRISEDVGFIDRENCLLVEQCDPSGLADALRWCSVHRDRLPAIGAAGQQLYRQRLSIDTIANLLVPALHQLAVANTKAAR